MPRQETQNGKDRKWGLAQGVQSVNRQPHALIINAEAVGIGCADPLDEAIDLRESPRGEILADLSSSNLKLLSPNLTPDQLAALSLADINIEYLNGQPLEGTRVDRLETR